MQIYVVISNVLKTKPDIELARTPGNGSIALNCLNRDYRQCQFTVQLVEPSISVLRTLGTLMIKVIECV